MVPIMWVAATGDRSQRVASGLHKQHRICPSRKQCLVGKVCSVLNSWGIRSREGLSEWIHCQDFRNLVDGHFNMAVNQDGRVAALEAAYVQDCSVILRERRSRNHPTAENRIQAQFCVALSWIQSIFLPSSQTLDCPPELPVLFQGQVSTGCLIGFGGTFSPGTTQSWRNVHGSCSVCCR